MTRYFHKALTAGVLCAAAIAFTAINVSAAADGTITGTVTAAGQSTNANTVVYVKKAPGTFKPDPAEIDQHDMKFKPHVLPIVLGSTVKFLNSDPVPHNVFSPNYEKYNLGTWKTGQSKTHAFKTCKKFPCVYTQLCLLHQEMSAYVVVLDNPYFAVTDASGHYTIKGVPAGSYTVAVWHSGKLKAAPKPVTVAAGKSADENFTLQR